jgi:hypothetical protein
LALGKTQVLRPNGIYSLFSNPALLKDSADTRLLEVGVSTLGDIDRIAGVFASLGGANTFPDSTIDDYIAQSLPRFPFGFNVTGPVALGIVNKGFGAALFTHIYSTSIIGNNRQIMNMNFDVIGIAGYGITLVDTYAVKFDIGFSVKGFFCYVSNLIEQSKTTSTNYIFYNNDEKNITGGGLNLGLLFSYKNFFSLSLSLQDAPAVGYVTPLENASSAAPAHPVFAEYIGIGMPNISIGFSFHVLNTAFADIKFFVEYRDIYTIIMYQTMAIPRNMLLNICVGAELIINTYFSIRAGMTDLMPSAGLGVNLKYFEIDLTYYGVENGYDIGQNSLQGFAAAFKFKF